MSLDSFSKWLTIIANIGVLAGILFLAIEISQNNQLMESEARLAQSNSAQEAWREIYQNDGTAELFAKVQAGTQLDDVERIKLEAYQRRQILSLQFQYLEFSNGMLDQINVPAWKALYRGTGARPPLDWGDGRSCPRRGASGRPMSNRPPRVGTPRPRPGAR